MRICFLLAVVVAVSSTSGRAAGPELTVGFAATNVTPKLDGDPITLAGFGQNRVATAVHDPIMARAVVLSDGTTKIGMVSVDVVGLFLPFVEEVRNQLSGFDYVLVSATHNHEGPDTLGLWGRSPFVSGINAKYMVELRDGIVSAVRAADKARVPAIARIGTIHTPKLIADNRLPTILHDKLVVVRFADPATDKPVGLMVQWHSHPETLGSKNTHITADFVASTVGRLEKEYQCPVSYFTGTVGGLQTSLGVVVRTDGGELLKDGTFEKAERYGVLVAHKAEEAIKAALPVKLTPFRIATRQVLVPVTNGLYRLAWQVGVLKRPMYAWNGDPSPARPMESQDATKPAAVLTEVGYLRFGDLHIAVIPGEIYPEIVLGKVPDPADPAGDYANAEMEPAIFSQLPAKHRMLIGLGNDEIGYLIPKRQWDEQPPYCFGRNKPQYGETNSVGPDAAGVICETFRNLAAGKQ